jgi:hypothetical protein
MAPRFAGTGQGMSQFGSATFQSKVNVLKRLQEDAAELGAFAFCSLQLRRVSNLLTRACPYRTSNMLLDVALLTQ